MADRPILFSAPMIQALLAGRKTQTRRVIKPQPDPFTVDDHGTLCEVGLLRVEGDPLPRVTLGRVITCQEIRCAMGDRLWVRETVAAGACAPSKPREWSPAFWRREQGTPANPNGLWYAADALAPERTITERGPWKPGIHMPRWASRLTLIVSDVRLQRLQEISAEDARDEGVDRRSRMVRQMWLFGADKAQREAIYLRACPWEFEKLWDEINGPGAWEANPWVVAYTFTVHRENIDRLPASEILECRA